MTSEPTDFLEKALIDRTRQGPVRWDMFLTIGEPGYPETDPTILWPKDRKELKVGTLTISSAMNQEGAVCENINYDPLVMANGIAATDDPVLLFRSSSYALSFTNDCRESDFAIQVQPRLSSRACCANVFEFYARAIPGSTAMAQWNFFRPGVATIDSAQRFCGSSSQWHPD